MYENVLFGAWLFGSTSVSTAQCSILGVGGFNPPLVPLNPPSFHWPLTGLVKNTLLTPLWFYHKSSTATAYGTPLPFVAEQIRNTWPRPDPQACQLNQIKFTDNLYWQIIKIFKIFTFKHIFLLIYVIACISFFRHFLWRASFSNNFMTL